MPPDPEIVAVREERERLKAGQFRIKGIQNEQRVRELTRLIATKQAQRGKEVRQEYRAHHFHHRPTWDVERQTYKEAEDQEEEYVEPAIDLHISKRAQLADIICNQPVDLDPVALLERRIHAEKLIVTLCSKQETDRQKSFDKGHVQSLAKKTPMFFPT